MSGKTLYPGAVPVFIAGDPWHPAGSAQTTPGTEQILINETVPVGKTLNLLSAYVSCVVDGTMRTTVDSTEVATTRTGAGSPNSPFFWVKPKLVQAGSQVKVTFKANQGTRKSEVQTYLDGAIT